LVPRDISSQRSLDRKLAHEAQAALLKAPVTLADLDQGRQLRGRLAKAERELKRIRHTIFVVMTILVLSLAGLAYCAVLLPQAVYKPTHFLTMTLSALVLAALIAQVEFFAYLLWHRSGVNRLHEECRRPVLARVESQLQASPLSDPSVEQGTANSS
jgi:cytochrome c-type biogenesis protein CcmH/NrfG